MTVLMFPPRLRAAAPSVVTVSYTAEAGTQANQSSYTFSSQSLGTAAVNRKIVVAVYGFTSGRTISSVTVDGVTATSLIDVASASNYRNALFIATVPTGATGDVVVNWTGSNQGTAIGVWAVYGASSTAFDTASDVLTPWSQTIDVAGGGAVIAAALQEGGSGTFSWTGVTEDYEGDFSSGSERHSGGHADELSAETGRTISVTMSASSNGSMTAISLQPA